MQTSTRLELLPQYRDATIAMEERRGQHWYRVDGHEDLLPSVTTFLKVIDKSGPLVGWAREGRTGEGGSRTPCAVADRSALAG